MLSPFVADLTSFADFFWVAVVLIWPVLGLLLWIVYMRAFQGICDLNMLSWDTYYTVTDLCHSDVCRIYSPNTSKLWLPQPKLFSLFLFTLYCTRCCSREPEKHCRRLTEVGFGVAFRRKDTKLRIWSLYRPQLNICDHLVVCDLHRKCRRKTDTRKA